MRVLVWQEGGRTEKERKKRDREGWESPMPKTVFPKPSDQLGYSGEIYPQLLLISCVFELLLVWIGGEGRRGRGRRRGTKRERKNFMSGKNRLLGCLGSFF